MLGQLSYIVVLTGVCNEMTHVLRSLEAPLSGCRHDIVAVTVLIFANVPHDVSTFTDVGKLILRCCF